MKLRQLVASFLGLVSALAIGFYYYQAPAVGGDGTIYQLSQWATSGGYITQNTADTLLKLTGYESSGDCLVTDASGVVSTAPCGTGGGSGDVVGPASATDNAIARYDTTTGKLIQDSNEVTIDDSGNTAFQSAVTTAPTISTGGASGSGNWLTTMTNTFVSTEHKMAWTMPTNTTGIAASSQVNSIEFNFPNTMLSVANTNDNLASYQGASFYTATFGLRNLSGSPQGVLPANAFRAFLGTDRNGVVGTLQQEPKSAITYRNVLDDGTAQLKMTVGNSLANKISMRGNTAGSSPRIEVTGSDANINLDIIPKGTGRIYNPGGMLTVGSSGFGTISPKTLLSIGNVSDNLLANTGSAALTIGASSATLFGIENTSASGAGGGAFALLYSNDGAAMVSGDRLGGVLIGGSSGAASLRNTSGVVSYATQNWVDASAYGSRIAFETTADNTTTRTERMTLLGNGNLGINTTAPTFPIHVVNNNTGAGVAVTGATSAGGEKGIYVHNTATDGYSSLRVGASSATAAGFSVEHRGTTFATDPDTSLFTGFGTGGMVFRTYTGTSPIAFWTGPTSASERMRILSGGNVGIGTTSPYAKFSVAGAGAFTGDVSVADTAYGAGWNASIFVPTRNAVYDIVETLGRIAGQIWTGVHDFGGATSLEIPNGTAPTVDTLGEIAFDTTDNQFLIATGTSARAIPTVTKIWSGTMASTSLDFASGGRIALPPHRDGLVITEVHCYVDGGTSKVINIDTMAGGAQLDSLTCGTTLTSDTAQSANYSLSAGALMALELGATTGAVDYVTFSVWGYIKPE